MGGEERNRRVIDEEECIEWRRTAAGGIIVVAIDKIAMRKKRDAAHSKLAMANLIGSRPTLRLSQARPAPINVWPTVPVLTISCSLQHYGQPSPSSLCTPF